jgi:outer membrane protein insertion porin family
LTDVESLFTVHRPADILLGMLPRRSVGRCALLAAGLVAVILTLAPGSALATGEQVTDVRILDNQRTEESTIRSIAGISIGDTLADDTLDLVRERLNTTGLFADVNVWWEPHGSGVRINISVADKFPWAPVPTGSWSSNNKAVGLIFVHGNLFGRGKQLLVGARLATIDSGAVVAYRDPSLFGTWLYWQLQGLVQRQVIPEYQSYGVAPNGDVATLATPLELRETRLLSYGFEPVIGIAWFRRVKTQIAWHLEKFGYFDNGSDDPNVNPPSMRLTQATVAGRVGVGRAALMFDFRAREFAVMTGGALGASLDYAGRDFGSDFTYWRAGMSWEQGIRFFRAHNLIYGAGTTVGSNLPFWAENTAGGSNLRGYLAQQFRGDTQVWGKAEYHFPLFSIGSLDFRGLGFYDVQAIWFRDLPTTGPVLTDPGGRSYYQRTTADQRTFPTTLQQGFSFGESVHDDVGVGLRFFLRSVAVPLVGFDAGYGIEANHWQFILVVGA